MASVHWHCSTQSDLKIRLLIRNVAYPNMIVGILPVSSKAFISRLYAPPGSFTQAFNGSRRLSVRHLPVKEWKWALKHLSQTPSKSGFLPRSLTSKRLPRGHSTPTSDIEDVQYLVHEPSIVSNIHLERFTSLTDTAHGRPGE